MVYARVYHRVYNGYPTMGVYLTGVYLRVVNLTGVYLRVVYLSAG